MRNAWAWKLTLLLLGMNGKATSFASPEAMTNRASPWSRVCSPPAEWGSCCLRDTLATASVAPVSANANLSEVASLMETCPSWVAPLWRRAIRRFPAWLTTLFHAVSDPRGLQRSGKHVDFYLTLNRCLLRREWHVPIRPINPVLLLFSASCSIWLRKMMSASMSLRDRYQLRKEKSPSLW